MSVQTKGTPIVYRAICRINGKSYVGMTIVGLPARKAKHFYYAERGGKGKFSAAIRKHGRDAFEFTVIATCKTIDDCRAEERKQITILKPDYNLTDGGEGVWGLRHSAESKAKMSAAKKGRSGHPCPEWLKKRNAELRRQERGLRKNPTRRRALKCQMDGLEFDCVHSASDHYGIPTWTIGYSARSSGNKTARGLSFVYCDRGD